MARHFEGNPPEIMVRPGGAVVSTNAVFGSAPANACPVHSLPADASVRQLTSPPGAERVAPAEAEEFIRLYHQENPQAGPPEARLRQVRVHIERFGTYWHTTDELAHGARVAWRNNSRCIGRLYWRSLRVGDRREGTGADEIAAECVAHLRETITDGRIRPTVTVFHPSAPDRPGPRIWNEQLTRYAGYRVGNTVVGDPRSLGDNGRYDQLPVIAERMGLDTSSERTLWRDLALVEANVAVLHSFALAGVTITDHHTESRRFLEHLRREEEAGRSCPADWSWIVPPVSGSTTPVFHRYYDDVELRPNYVYHPEAVALARGNHPRSSA